MLRNGAMPAYVIYVSTDLAVPLYRVVGRPDPIEDDFRSYFLAGRRFAPHLYFQAIGVSMFAKKSEAEKLARGGTLGSYVATLEISDQRVHLALTHEKTAHFTVWGYPQYLLGSVVNCAATGVG